MPTLLKLANMGKPPQALRIVALGGGTGLPIVLEGCKTYCGNLSAIVTVTDSGRSSGRLRDELGILPPGDARNCLIALSQPGEKERLLNQLFQYRFDQGSFTGMSLGNLAIAAMIDMEGSFERGIRVLSNLLNIRGRVLPPTVANCDLCAELEDGSTREGEVAVRETGKPPIKRVFLKPRGPARLPGGRRGHPGRRHRRHRPRQPLHQRHPQHPGARHPRGAGQHAGPSRSTSPTSSPSPARRTPSPPPTTCATSSATPAQGVVDYAVFNCSVPADDILERYRAEGAEIVVANDGVGELGVKHRRGRPGRGPGRQARAVGEAGPAAPPSGQAGGHRLPHLRRPAAADAGGRRGLPVSTTVRPMTIDDYDAVSALWRASEGVGLRAADQKS